MKTDVVYELTRIGKPFPIRLGILRPIPDGLSVLSYEGYDFTLTWEDDDQFYDSEAQGVVEVVTNDERWVFTKLMLSNWEEMEPFFGPKIPDFETDEEVNKYFYDDILRAL